VDSGTYILTDTVVVPKDAKIHGEAWSQFAASGSAFSDAKYAVASRPRYVLLNAAFLVTLVSCFRLEIGAMLELLNYKT
jgi:hypothetical protein